MKSKKVLTILLALAIMVTFMPTMAFANVKKPNDGKGTTGVWATDGSYVTVNGQNWTARRELSVAPGQTAPSGKIVAKLDDSAYDDTALETVPYVPNAYYYDLTGATLRLADIYTQTSFKALFTQTGGEITADSKLNAPRFDIKTPTYVYDYSNQPKTIEDVELQGWTVTVAFPDSYVENSEADQTVTLTAVIESDGANGTYSAPNRIDSTTITKTVKVLGELPSVTGIKFYKDKAVAANQIAGSSPDADGNFDIVNTDFAYDGDAHKVVTNNVTGYTITYATLNKATGKYENESSECPTVTNVGDVKKVQAKISWTKTTTNGDQTTTTKYTKTDIFTLSVAQVNDLPGFEFDGKGDIRELNNITNNVPANLTGTDSYIYSVEAGKQYDASQWVDPVYVSTPTDSDKKALKANDAALMDFFNDFYTIKVTKKAAYPDYEFLSIEKKEAKDFDDATFKALKTKHATLLKNFLGYTDAELKDETLAGLLREVNEAKNTEGAVYFVKSEPTPVVANDQDDDINFSGVTKYVYSGKKAIKKGKLKKNQKIAVKAVADSGNEVTFSATTADKKITVNSTTGKITVKKGLKKGTYKVQVTAKTAAGNGYKAAKATATYTIVVKKK